MQELALFVAEDVGHESMLKVRPIGGNPPAVRKKPIRRLFFDKKFSMIVGMGHTDWNAIRQPRAKSIILKGA